MLKNTNITFLSKKDKKNFFPLEAQVIKFNNQSTNSTFLKFHFIFMKYAVYKITILQTIFEHNIFSYQRNSNGTFCDK